MTLRITCASLLALSLSSSSAIAEQFVAVDVTYTHSPDTTKDSHYFVKPSAATPSNWRAPINYAGGTVHLHFEVLTKPSKEPTVWVVCFIGTPGYACTDSGTYTATGIYERSHTLPSLWQYDQVDWAQKISQIPLILKDDMNVKIAPENVGAARSSLFMPTAVRMVVTIVSAGGTYVPPDIGNGGTTDSGTATDAANEGATGNENLEDAMAPTFSDQGVGALTNESSSIATHPVTMGGSPSEAGAMMPSENGTLVSDMEGAGCSLGHGRTPGGLAAFLALLMLAFRRRRGPATAAR